MELKGSSVQMLNLNSPTDLQIEKVLRAILEKEKVTGVGKGPLEEIK